jgi:hypothetical protein
MSTTLTSSTNTNSFFDAKLGVYCFPIAGNLQRIREATKTIKEIVGKTIGQANVLQKRCDFGKWIVGQIPTQVLNQLNPLIALMDGSLMIAAFALSLLEQIVLSFVP